MFRGKSRRLLGFAIGFLAHSIAIALFRLSNGPAVGPDADSSAMVWSIWFLLDMPLSVFYVWVFDFTDTISMIGMGLTGGVQWGIWAVVASMILSYLSSNDPKKDGV